MLDINKLKIILGNSIDQNSIQQMKLEFSEISNKIKITEQGYTFDPMNNPFFMQPNTVDIKNSVNPDLDLYITLLNTLDTPIVFNQSIMMT